VVIELEFNELLFFGVEVPQLERLFLTVVDALNFKLVLDLGVTIKVVLLKELELGLNLRLGVIFEGVNFFLSLGGSLCGTVKVKSFDVLSFDTLMKFCPKGIQSNPFIDFLLIVLSSNLEPIVESIIESLVELLSSGIQPKPKALLGLFFCIKFSLVIGFSSNEMKSSFLLIKVSFIEFSSIVFKSNQRITH
jgi:hypothetical protein